ncbi:MAG TPA: hypothetical protein VHE37_05910, partial [Nevskiaceae bacterium]|nr:hypothetical protein [Nevskiaceae bacterium]
MDGQGFQFHGTESGRDRREIWQLSAEKNRPRLRVHDTAITLRGGETHDNHDFSSTDLAPRRGLDPADPAL